MLDQDVGWTWSALSTWLLLTQLWFLVQGVGVGHRAVHDYHCWLSARPNAHKSVAKPADTDRLRIWLKRSRESCSPPWGLLAGCVDMPLEHFSIKKEEKIATAGQVL